MTALFGTGPVDTAAAAISDVFDALTAARIDLPTVQPLVPYLEFLGEAYRQNIVAHGGDEHCLCPDLTLALALQISGGQTPIGAYRFDGLVFRGSRGDLSASPVQRQIGIEIFDTPENAADDRRIIRAASDALEAAGLRGHTLTFADPGLVYRLIDSFDLHPNWKARLKKSFSMPATFERDLSDAANVAAAPALPRALAGLSRHDARDALADMFDMVDIAPFGARTLEDITDRLIDKANEAGQPLKPEDADALRAFCRVDGALQPAMADLTALLDGRGAAIMDRMTYWQTLIAELAASGLDLRTARFDANLGRELSYYDGFVFECHAADGTVLGGGGRYDGLLSALSGGALHSGAVGAMLRPDRIAAMLEGGA